MSFVSLWGTGSAIGTFLASSANAAIAADNRQYDRVQKASEAESAFFSRMCAHEEAIRHALNPIDAHIGYQNLMEFLECGSSHLITGRITVGARERVRKYIAQELIYVDRTWSEDEKRKLLYAGERSYPAIQQFWHRNRELIQQMEDELVGNGQGRVQWRAPISAAAAPRQSHEQSLLHRWPEPEVEG